MKHTPEPWKIEPYQATVVGHENWYKFTITAHEEGSIHPVYGVKTVFHPRFICDVKPFASKLESEANARLIAAAPDMLKELKNVRNWMAKHGMEYDADYMDIDNIINKAEGKPCA